MTRESLVVAERVARAVRISAGAGVLKLEDFPLLLHIDDILTKKAAVELPWNDFRFVKA